MQGIAVVIVLVILSFIGFVIYFIFKQLEFVIQAINLYKKMINRQDAMLKLLKDIRGSGNYQDDVKIRETPRIDEPPINSSQITEDKGSSGHHWGDNPKTHDIIKTCPLCNGIFHGAEFETCGVCICALVQPQGRGKHHSGENSTQPAKKTWVCVCETENEENLSNCSVCRRHKSASQESAWKF